MTVLHYVGFARDLAAANLGRAGLPFKVTFVATYKCNFRCEMCGIWQKHSTDEMTPDEVALFFDRASQFRWVHLTGGELFMRRDLENLVEAIQRNCRSLFLLNFPTTGWFVDRTVALVDAILTRGIDRLMVTVSLDGPRDMHEEIRGLPGSWDRAVETFGRLRQMRRDNFDVVLGMTLLPKNVGLVDATLNMVREHVPGLSATELHLNVPHESPHYFDNMGLQATDSRRDILNAVGRHREGNGPSLHPARWIEDRYQYWLERYYATNKSPLPCSALAGSCFIDPYWNLFPCSIWDAPLANLRAETLDFERVWRHRNRSQMRQRVVDEECPHCWTPCEAYPTILSNVVGASRNNFRS